MRHKAEAKSGGEKVWVVSYLVVALPASPLPPPDSSGVVWKTRASEEARTQRKGDLSALSVPAPAAPPPGILYRCVVLFSWSLGNQHRYTGHIGRNRPARAIPPAVKPFGRGPGGGTGSCLCSDVFVCDKDKEESLPPPKTAYLFSQKPGGGGMCVNRRFSSDCCSVI